MAAKWRTYFHNPSDSVLVTNVAIEDLCNVQSCSAANLQDGMGAVRSVAGTVSHGALPTVHKVAAESLRYSLAVGVQFSKDGMREIDAGVNQQNIHHLVGRQGLPAVKTEEFIHSAHKPQPFISLRLSADR